MSSVQEVVGRLNDVHEYAHYYSARCIFHSPDNHPSMLVYKAGWFHCLACDKQGDLRLLERTLNGDRIQVSVSSASKGAPSFLHVSNLERLCSVAHDVLSNQVDGLGWYLRVRGIDNMIDPLGIGWYNGWLTFPLYDDEGNFSGVVLRSEPTLEQQGQPRYVLRTEERLYIPDRWLINTSPYVVVTFGIIDAISLLSLGIPALSTVWGKRMVSADLEEYRKPIMFFPDRGEETAAYKISTMLGWRGSVLEFPYPDGMKDPNDLYRNGLSVSILEHITKRLQS